MKYSRQIDWRLFVVASIIHVYRAKQGRDSICWEWLLFFSEKLWHQTEWAPLTELSTHYHHLFTITECELLIITTFYLSFVSYGLRYKKICHQLLDNKKIITRKRGLNLYGVNWRLDTDWHPLKLIKIHIRFKHQTSFSLSICHCIVL